MAGLLDGGFQWLDDLLALLQAGQIFQVLRDRLAGDGHAIAVEQLLIQQVLHHRRGAADVMHVLHDVLAAWFQVRDVGDAIAHLLKVIDGERYVHGAGDGDEVQHGVGGAAEGHDHDHGVLESLTRHDVAGLEVLFHQRADGLPCLQAFGDLGAVGSGTGGAVWQRHAHGFDGGSHGVGRVHAAAGASAGAGVAHDVLSFIVGDGAGNVLAVALEGGDDVQSLAAAMARSDGTAVDHQGGPVDAPHGHHDARHVLVATGDRDEAVVPLAAHHGFHRIGDEVAGL